MRWMHRQVQLVSYSTRASVVLRFDSAQLFVGSRHDALDSPSTLGIQVPSPLGSGRNSVRELHAQRRHVLGDGGGGSMGVTYLFVLVRVFVYYVRSGYLL